MVAAEEQGTVLSPTGVCGGGGGFVILAAAANAISDGVVPMFLGGDHMVTHPIVGLVAERGRSRSSTSTRTPTSTTISRRSAKSRFAFARIMEGRSPRSSFRSGSAPQSALPGTGEEVRRRDGRMRDFAPDRCRSPAGRSTSASTWTRSTRPSLLASRTTSPAAFRSATCCPCSTASRGRCRR